MLTRCLLPLLLFLLICLPDIARAEQSPPTSLVITLPTATKYGGIRIPVPPPAARQKTVSLALAGGGARAAASIGVLRVLEQEGIPIAAIAGTSMGAGIGGLYAAGYSSGEIEQIFLANDWNDIFRDTPPRAFLTQEQKEAGSRHLLEFLFEGGRLIPPSGFTAGQKLTNMLAGRTLAASFEADMDFDRLRVPFRAMATDIETGEAVPIGRGLLHDAIRASAAIPLVFQPVEIEGRLLVDGGMSNNLPVEVARSLGGDIVIAVDRSSPLERKDQLQSLISIFNQAISLQVRPETDRQALLADLLIVPRTEAFSFADFPAMAEIIKTGEEAAHEALPRIRELLQRKTEPSEMTRYRIINLTVRGAGADEASVRLALSTIVAPREVTEQDILAAMAGAVLSGTYSDIVMELTPSDGAYHAVLTVRTGPLVSEIDVSGNTILTTAEVREILGWQMGQRLNGARLSNELEKMVQHLRAQGYLLARVEHAGILADGHTLGIVFSEGMVNSISYRGQPRTRRSLIQRETVTRAGKPLNFVTAADDIQHLYALDYFEAIDADLSRSPGGGVDIRLNIREKPSNRIRLGLRYDLDDSFTGLTDIISDNITGRGIKAFLYTRYGNYTDVAAGYTSPVLIRSYFLHTVQAFYRQRDYLIYADHDEVDELDIRRSGVDFAFGYQWFRFGDTYLRYRYSADRARSLNGTVDAAALTHTGSLAFLSTIDTQDRRTFPRTGLLLKGSYESAAPAYGGSQEYRKTSLSADGCMTLADRHTFLLAITAGLGSGGLPYQEQFGIGGTDGLLGFPLPGYHRREFVGMNELGALVTYRWLIAEHHLTVVKAIYFALSGGAANVWDVRDDMSPQDLWTGAGIGLHADTVIGPVRLDFGAGEDRRYLVYFSAGFDF